MSWRYGPGRPNRDCRRVEKAREGTAEGGDWRDIAVAAVCEDQNGIDLGAEFYFDGVVPHEALRVFRLLTTDADNGSVVQHTNVPA